MKIGIIGVGIIGGACKYGFEKLGHQVICHDIALKTSIEDVLDTHITYVCVPTPSDEDGSCNTSIVENVVHELHTLGYSGIVAIKSTVKPTTTEKLIKETGMEICFVPEFLRERCSISDFTENHDLLAIGSHSQTTYEMVKRCHGSYPKSYSHLKPTEAELLKYYSNVINALKVVFANEMYEICKTVGADYTKIKETFIKRGTTKDLYLDVNDNFRGYAGMCLPKDTKALDSFVKELGLDLKLFETMESENNKFKKTVFDGMRL
jgi:nucleotide sugar dehydrogenase